MGVLAINGSNRAPISVLIVDGDPLLYRALVRLLQGHADIKVLATAPDGPTALEMAAQLHPTVALVDVGNKRLDGMEITRRLSAQNPDLCIVVLSVYATFRDQALAAGACQFLLKDSGREELLAAIRLAAQGQCQGDDNRRNMTFRRAANNG